MIGVTMVNNTGLELLMSNAPMHNIIRSVIIVGLLILGMTTRPRARALRFALGVIASVITGIALTQTFNYSLQIMDALIYLASATVFMNEAIESEPIAEPVHAVKKLGAA